MNIVPTICGVEINTDAEGRFNLNAIHRASGLGPGKAPPQWLRTQSTQELVNELKNTDVQNCISVHKGGSGVQGTFAHELLAVSYAGWISPAFQLTVNRAFIESRTAREGGHEFLNPVLRSIQETLVQVDRVERKQAEQDGRLAAVEARQDRMDGDTGYMTVTAFLRTHDVHLPLSDANEFGRRAARVCRDRGFPVGSIPDERFGRVNSYPVGVLREVGA